jgi:pilus assembly protein CpaB
MLALVLGVLGAILLYSALSRDSEGTTASIGQPGVPVVVAKMDIPARTRINASMVETKLVPPDSRSLLAYERVEDVVGQVTRHAISTNEHVLSNKIIEDGATASGRALTYVVPEGKRGFAIKISEVANVGGLVLPGDYVDIVVIYDVEFPKTTSLNADRELVEAYFVQTILQNVEVLAVSQTVVDLVPEAGQTVEGQRARNTEAGANPSAATVTLALTPEQVHLVFLAESNGYIRLAVRPFGDGDVLNLDYMIKPELVPPNLPNPFLQR